jgi:hypothetical protein
MCALLQCYVRNFCHGSGNHELKKCQDFFLFFLIKDVYFVGFQDVTLATMKNTIFWDVISCNLVEIL